jgi:hypothetical protein
VLKVYLVQSKKYAHHLCFVRTLAREWVLEALKVINSETVIGFEAKVKVKEETKLQK